MIKAIIFDWTGTLYERNKGLFSFTKEVLDQLKPKYKLGMVSKSKNITTRRKRIENSAIKNYFYSILVVDKKTTKQFKQSMDELGVKPSETVIVGDRASRDIKPGNELGCKTVWIQIGDRSYDSPTEETGEPDYRIDSIKELLNIL